MFRSYERRVKSVSDLKRRFPEAVFMAVVDDSVSGMGFDYGPPDPPPSMETTYFISMYALHNEDEVIEWVKDHTRRDTNKPYQILSVKPVAINTTLSVSLG